MPHTTGCTDFRPRLPPASVSSHHDGYNNVTALGVRPRLSITFPLTPHLTITKCRRLKHHIASHQTYGSYCSKQCDSRVSGLRSVLEGKSRWTERGQAAWYIVLYGQETKTCNKGTNGHHSVQHGQGSARLGWGGAIPASFILLLCTTPQWSETLQ